MWQKNEARSRLRKNRERSTVSDLQSPPLLPDELSWAVVSPKVYADQMASEAAFARMRADYPLAKTNLDDFSPFWVVTKHADILEISRQNDLFHNGDLAATLTTKAADKIVRGQTGGSPHLIRTLVQMDAPDHPKFRVMTQAWFMPQNLKKLEVRIRDIAKAYVDKMASMNGECDFLNDIALYFPLRVIMEILGVPEEDEPRMLKLTQELFGAQDQDVNRSGEDSAANVEKALADIQAVLMDFFMYFNNITMARRALPTEDVATVIANAKMDGEDIGAFEAVSYYTIIATAGHDTTSSSTAGGMLGLIENPDQLAAVKADLSLIAGLVDESIRMTTPVKHFMRSATADYELRGQKIKKGDWLFLAYPSGNRDEEVFDEPYKFKIDRTPNKHLAFGYGAHLCLGQHLAKMEMRIFWEELLPRLKSVELSGQPKLTEANFVGGLKSLPIRYVME
jgi:cytochrome P450